MKRKGTIMLVVMALLVSALLVATHKGQEVIANDSIGETEAVMIFTGEAEISVAPDIVYIYLGVETQEDTAREAQLKNAEAMSQVYKSLEKIGVTKKNIETTSFRVEPVREYLPKTQEWVSKGYKAINQVKITLTDLDKTGEVIDAAVASGSNTVQNIIFSVKDETQWKIKALEEATKNAKAKAEAVASVLDLTITGIKYVSDRSGNTILYAREMAKVYGGEMLAPVSKTSTPIQAGDVQIRASVEVSFTVK